MMKGRKYCRRGVTSNMTQPVTSKVTQPKSGIGPDSNTNHGPAIKGKAAAGSSRTWETRAPMYSIGAPYRQQILRQGPAPNSYQLPSTLGTRLPTIRAAPATSFHGTGPANKGFSFDSARTPGPAGYNPSDISKTRKRAPTVSMKGRTKLPAIKMGTPGPGAYDTSKLSLVGKSSPQFSFGVRHGDKVRPLYTAADE